MTSRKCCIIWIQNGIRQSQSPRPSLLVFILKELNAVEGEVWFRDYYLVVISVANYSDGHYNLPQISLPGSDLHYSLFTVYAYAKPIAIIIYKKFPYRPVIKFTSGGRLSYKVVGIGVLS